MNKNTFEPIAYIRTDFKEKFGIPRQSGRVDNLCKIIFYPKFRNPDALRGIENFNYLWLLFDFSLNQREKFSPTVRPPRLGGNKKVGVFATRSPFRPNNIGLSSVKLVDIRSTLEFGTVLTVTGADLLDKTPIYDIKPYIPSTDCHNDAIGGFADEFTNYKLNIDFPNELLSVIPEEKRKVLIECLKDDPRPSYQEDGEIYGMKFDLFNIKFTVKENTVNVLEIEKL